MYGAAGVLSYGGLRVVSGRDATSCAIAPAGVVLCVLDHFCLVSFVGIKIYFKVRNLFLRIVWVSCCVSIGNPTMERKCFTIFESTLKKYESEALAECELTLKNVLKTVQEWPDCVERGWDGPYTAIGVRGVPLVNSTLKFALQRLKVRWRVSSYDGRVLMCLAILGFTEATARRVLSWITKANVRILCSEDAVNTKMRLGMKVVDRVDALCYYNFRLRLVYLYYYDTFVRLEDTEDLVPLCGCTDGYVEVVYAGSKFGHGVRATRDVPVGHTMPYAKAGSAGDRFREFGFCDGNVAWDVVSPAIGCMINDHGLANCRLRVRGCYAEVEVIRRIPKGGWLSLDYGASYWVEYERSMSALRSIGGPQRLPSTYSLTHCLVVMAFAAKMACRASMAAFVAAKTASVIAIGS